MTEVWDLDESTGPVLRSVQISLPRRAGDFGEITPGESQATHTARDEVTPLLNAPTTSIQVGSYGGLDSCVGRESHVSADRSLLCRKPSTISKRSYNYGGQSTYGQTVGNVI